MLPSPSGRTRSNRGVDSPAVFGTIEAGRPEAVGAEISSTTMADSGPNAKRPRRSAHRRSDPAKTSQQRPPAHPIHQPLEPPPTPILLLPHPRTTLHLPST